MDEAAILAPSQSRSCRRRLGRSRQDDLGPVLFARIKVLVGLRRLVERQIARRNIKKAAAAAMSRKTIAQLSAKTRTALRQRKWPMKSADLPNRKLVAWCWERRTERQVQSAVHDGGRDPRATYRFKGCCAEATVAVASRPTAAGGIRIAARITGPIVEPALGSPILT